MRSWIENHSKKSEELATFLERAVKYELQLKRGEYKDKI